MALAADRARARFVPLLVGLATVALLAAGCTIVSKPASQTPLCLVQVFECLIDAGLPAGVANLVIGNAQEVSEEFLDNPICRKISFTGSTEVGKQLMRGAADQVKLGSTRPIVVDVPVGQGSQIKTDVQRPEPLLAPLTAGQAVGTLRVSLAGQPVAEHPLQALQAVPRAGWFGRLWDAARLSMR